MPKITIIVPVYKAEAFLADCVDSILSQTFSDFEVILVDDGSPDNCGAICEAYAKQDSRVSVLHQVNQGQAAARNHALIQAKGEWICFVDSDDLIHPQTLELLYQAAMESGAGISMCQMLESPVLPDDFLLPREGNFEVLTMDEHTLVRLHDAEEYPAWVACAKLIRRELVEAYPFQEGRVYEDNEAVCRWVCGAGRLARISQPLYFYRTNPDSTTKGAFHMKQLDYLWALESIIRYYGDLGYLQLRDRFLDRYAEAAASKCYGLRNGFERPDVIPQIEKQVRAFLWKEKLHLTQAQFEPLLDSMHPTLIRFYWPAAGIWRRIKKLFGKGERK